MNRVTRRRLLAGGAAAGAIPLLHEVVPHQGLHDQLAAAAGDHGSHGSHDPADGGGMSAHGGGVDGPTFQQGGAAVLDQRIPRCAGEQYPRLALGQNDMSVFHRTLPWDHVPGILFLEEAGGKAARPNGTPYRFADGEQSILGASTPELWDRGAEILFA